MVKLQITLTSTEGYKPMSTIVEIADKKEYLYQRKEIHNKAIVKICAQRHMTLKDLTYYGYTKVKAREYNPEAIAEANAERYEQIKAERGWK
jgi:hypothetical protein